MSSFFGFNIARSGLFASQRALDVTAHNIANANTPGYSRQRVTIVQSNPITAPGGQGMIGTGVDTKAVEQIRNKFLDFKIRQEFTTEGEWKTRAETLQHIEAIFNEPSDSGIRQVMDDFFNSLQQLSKNENADDTTVRTEVRQRGIALTKTLNYMYDQLQDLQKSTDFTIETTVNQINGYAKQIASLNQQIFKYEVDGSNANDLRDQRNLLIDELSELVDIQVNEMPIGDTEEGTGSLQILVDGNILVSHFQHNSLKLTQRKTKNNSIDNPNLLEVSWDNGMTLNMKSGKLKGLLDMRDNISGSEKGIPYYMDKLNRFTTVFSARFNMQHGKGYGLSGSGNHIPFFNGPEMDYSSYTNGYEKIDAKDISYLAGKSDEEKIAAFEEQNAGYTILRAPKEQKTIAKDAFNTSVDLSTTISGKSITINGIDVPLDSLDNLSSTAPGYTIGDVKSKLQADIDAVFDGTAHGGLQFTVNSDGGKISIEASEGVVDFKGSDSTALSTLGFAEDRWYKVEIVKSNEIGISEEINDHLNNIAAASFAEDSDGDGTLDSGLAGDGSNAFNLHELRNDVEMFTWGGPDDYFKSLVSNLGVDSNEAKRMTNNQEVLINDIDNKRKSISGVSLDEEMANMVKFQHSYNANARMITTIDEMLDKLINGMGVVGR